MKSDAKELIRTIQFKAKSLVKSYNTLQNKYDKLKTENEELKQTITSQKEIVEQLNNNNQSKLIAKSIKQEEGNIDVKKQIDEMVREIDKCIELLNK